MENVYIVFMLNRSLMHLYTSHQVGNASVSGYCHKGEDHQARWASLFVMPM